MKSIALLLSLVYIIFVVDSASINGDAKAEVEQFSNDEFRLGKDGSGSYKYSFKTSNGIQREETGSITKGTQTDDILVVRGSYSYLGPDGITYTVNYVADGDGFHPEGDHIQVPPSADLPVLMKHKYDLLKLDFIYKPDNQVYHFPSAALASLTGANIG